MIDLRSDTVTQPSMSMRRAMARAEVGDDVFREDPTVAALEARAAEVTGAEAGLFVASGTMGNLTAMLATAPRGTEVIAPAGAHIATGELANAAVVVGAAIREVPWRPDGTYDGERLRDAFRERPAPASVRTALVTIENTHSLSMGQPLPPDYIEEVAGLATTYGAGLFVDGARLFNAAVALGVPASRLIPPGTLASFCLSKGLGCPVGSVVVGPIEHVESARWARKLLGGGMRQAGILAAAGVEALRDLDAITERLSLDHANARRLADGLAGLRGINRLDPGRVRTNAILFGIEGGDWHGAPEARSRAASMRDQFLASMRDRGVRMIPYAEGRIRAMTHWNVSPADVDRALRAARSTLLELGR